MPDRIKLEEQVNILRGQLEQQPPLSEEKREALEALIAKFELQLELEPATQTPVSQHGRCAVPERAPGPSVAIT